MFIIIGGMGILPIPRTHAVGGMGILPIPRTHTVGDIDILPIPRIPHRRSYRHPA
ncbi:hypothetical protein [Leyella stercorea]|uniref:hypothetical protein n=1 Tax=Leyella stercorea TaxID=363265 RepID=UPI00242A51BB|nr:hypothetical protein [Leyella stercorea]